MIFDLNTLENKFLLTSDVCIIGSGAAGLAIAKEFLESGVHVVMLESGDWDFREEIQRLNECVIEGMNFTGASEGGRYRRFGGTTTMWGGQCFEFADIDFEERSYIPHSGWPVGRIELRPFYQRANQFFQLDDLNYDTDLCRLLGLPQLQFSPESLNHRFSKWVPQPNIRKVYQDAIGVSHNVNVYLKANVVDIELNDSLENAERVLVKSLEGKKGKIESKIVVLCCGGIENARILLFCNRQRPDGLGNSSGLVGRYFADHPAAKIGIIKPRNKSVLQYFATHVRNGIKYTPRFTLDERAQRKYELPNASGSIALVPAAFFETLKEVWVAVRSGRVDKDTIFKIIALGTRPEVYEIAYQYLVHKRVIQPSIQSLDLNVLVEQEPMNESYVALSSQTDGLGQPKAVINWMLSDLTGKTLSRYANIFKREFEVLGLGEVSLSDWLADWQQQWRGQVQDQAHHIGTTRMGLSTQTGVVNTNSRLHDVENIYVAGSSVFPTGGHSSPTLTNVALSIRLADHLKKKLEMSS